MTVLNGKQAKLYVLIDGVYKLVMCAVSVSWFFRFEEVLKTDRNAGRFRKRMSRLCDWGFNLSGLTKVDNSDGQASYFWLSQASVRGTEQYFKMTYTDVDGNEKNVSGYCIVMEGMLESVVGGFSTGTVSLPGSGAFVTDAVPGFTDTDLFKLYLTITPGAWEVSHNDLGGATEIMLVIREDGGYKEVGGAPVGRQFMFTDHTTFGTLTFDSTLPFNAGEVPYVQYKKAV